MASAEEQKKLVINPIDTWTTREKLALATSVQKSGDQNWSSVSRSLKPFAEPGRPADWFSQKFCAIQYNFLMDQFEAPKRKRGERGGITHQEIIVEMLINEREDELNNQIEKTVLEYLELKKDLELLKSNKGEEITKKMRKIYHENQIKKREDEIKHKNWLTEREKRISQLKLLRGNQLTQKQAKINSSITIESENVKTLDEKEKIIPITEKSVTSNISESITNVQATVSNSVDLSISSPKTVKIQEEQTEDSKDNIDQIDLNKEENISNNTELDKNNTTDETSVNLDNEATTEESTSETYESVVEEQVFQNEIKTEDEPIVEENITTLEPEAVESIECVNETDNAIKNDQPVTEVVIEQEASNDSKVSNPADYPSDTPSDNRRKKKKYLKNKPNIPTRSTRSQTLVKTEMETKETPIKLETTKVNSKKRSTSIEESSAYTMSEESNGPKTPLSAPNQNEVDNGWREVGLEILHSLLNHRHISFLETKISTELKPRDDLSVIQRQVETGQVKTFDELRKALMFFFFNLNMLNTDKSKSDKFMELEKFVLNKIDQNEHNKFEKSEIKNRRKTRRSVSNESETSLKIKSIKKKN